MSVARSLAIAYQLRGASDSAAAERTRFLELWKNADPEVRQLGEPRQKSASRANRP